MSLHPAQEAALKWLRSGLSGCWFATNVAAIETAASAGTAPDPKKSRIGLPVVASQADVPVIAWEFLLDTFSARGLPAIILLPWVASERQLIEVILSLSHARTGRWICTIRDEPEFTQAGATAVRVRFRTEGGELSEAMGFAPLFTMPPTRRTPFVGIGAWAGGYDNPYIPWRKGLSFVHMPPRQNEALQRKLFEQSEEWTATRMGQHSIPAVKYRRVTFGIGREARDALIAGGIVPE